MRVTQHFHDSRTLDVHVRRLRQQLGVHSSAIETVIGVGYRLLELVTADENVGS
ncbi:MAG: helix-turn-helix domain-containing protein [Pyrinomonadaceae bacterium]